MDISNTAESLKERLAIPSWLKLDNTTELCLFSAISYGAQAAETIWETVSQYNNLYEAIMTARLNLLLASKAQSYFTHIDEDWLFVKTTFVNNAIMWYNSSFDILLQCFWFYFQIYKNNNKLKKELGKTELVKLNSNTFPSIISHCNYVNVAQYLHFASSSLCSGLEILHEKFSKIHDWANTLKHRGNLRYQGYNDISFELRVNKNSDLLSSNNDIIYCSADTVTTITVEQAINELQAIHADIVDFTKEMCESFGLDNKISNFV